MTIPTSIWLTGMFSISMPLLICYNVLKERDTSSLSLELPGPERGYPLIITASSSSHFPPEPKSKKQRIEFGKIMQLNQRVRCRTINLEGVFNFERFWISLSNNRVLL